MSTSLDIIKKLRMKTKAGILDCRQALDASDNDLKKAEEWLRNKGIKSADKRVERQTSAGLVEAYTHGEGKIVGIVELSCETDFVARTAEFKDLAHQLAMQVAAMKSKNVKEFLSQVWIRDQGRKIEELVKELSGKTGENIKVNRVARFELGEEI